MTIKVGSWLPNNIQGEEKVWKSPLKNLKKYKFYKKIFQTKVVEFKKIYLLIYLSIY